MRPLVRAAASIALLAIAAQSSLAANSSTLKWGRGAGDTAAPKTMHASASVQANAVRIANRAPVFARAKEINSLRPQRHVDSAVQQAAFEDNGPQFAQGSSSSSQPRSVIVESNQAEDGFRSAQLPSSSPAGGASASGPGAAGPGATGPGATGPADIQRPSDVGGPMDATRSVDPSTTPDFTAPLDTGDLPPLDEPLLEELDTPAAPTDSQNRTQFQPGRGMQPGGTSVQPPAGFRQRQPSTNAGPGGPLPADVPPLNEATIEQERQKSQQDCTEGLNDLKAKTIDKLSLSIAVTGEQGADYPYECTLDEGAWHGGRCWEQTTFMWKASALCHKPLYFEDEQLERYGHSWPPCFQPFISGAHFFCTLPVLPYCMGVEPPCECIYALGHYRPGNCAPYMCNPIPLSPRGALFQAGAVYGAAALP